MTCTGNYDTLDHVIMTHNTHLLTSLAVDCPDEWTNETCPVNVYLHAENHNNNMNVVMLAATATLCR